MLKKIVLLITFAFVLNSSLFSVKPVFATCNPGLDASNCSSCGGANDPRCNESVNGNFCTCTGTGTSNSDNPFGNIINPLPGGGLIPLLSNVLRLIFVIAGIYAFLRIVLAGLAFIGAGGDPKRIEQAWGSIWQSILGLVIIVASFAIAAIISQVLFGRWDAILNPQIYGPGTAP